MQGDVLERTPEIDGLLQEVHPHFYSEQKNRFLLPGGES